MDDRFDCGSILFSQVTCDDKALYKVGLSGRKWIQDILGWYALVHKTAVQYEPIAKQPEAPKDTRSRLASFLFAILQRNSCGNVTIRTAEGRVVETLEHNGRNTPFRHKEFVVLRVAVDGKPYPSWQIPGYVWDEEAGTMTEQEFWQNVADYALTMGDVEATLRN